MPITKETFLKNVKDHVLTIVKDDGLHRHLKVAEPGNSNRHYDITTWPNYLCISGDMGCFVFSRTEDMFNFFRSPELRINDDYWSEKCKAQSIFGDGIREFDSDALESVIKEAFDAYADDAEWDESEKDMWWEDVESNILSQECSATASQAIWDFINNNDWAESVFQDISHDFTRHTGHFIWCCYAITHAINLYDTLKVNNNEA